MIGQWKDEKEEAIVWAMVTMIWQFSRRVVSQTTVHYKFITNVSIFTIVRSLKMTVKKSKRPKLLFKIIFKKGSCKTPSKRHKTCSKIDNYKSRNIILEIKF